MSDLTGPADARATAVDAAMPSGSAAGPSAPPIGLRNFRGVSSNGEALESLKAFVRNLGVEEPAATEEELLLQAAPYMSESLDANLKHAWSPEERARLDAMKPPEQLDHTNKDHEYFFFKQMRESLDRRASRSSGVSQRSSVDVSARWNGSTTEKATSPEEVASWRAECRRNNLQAVWGEQGRAVLTALDSLPEADVLLDVTPPASPTTQGSSSQHNRISHESTSSAQQQQQQRKLGISLVGRLRSWFVRK